MGKKAVLRNPLILKCVTETKTHHAVEVECHVSGSDVDRRRWVHWGAERGKLCLINLIAKCFGEKLIIKSQKCFEHLKPFSQMIFSTTATKEARNVFGVIIVKKSSTRNLFQFELSSWCCLSRLDDDENEKFFTYVFSCHQNSPIPRFCDNRNFKCYNFFPGDAHISEMF